MQKHVNLVYEYLIKSIPTNIFLQNLASIQRRTSPVKFAHLAEKSGKGSISNLSTKVDRETKRVENVKMGRQVTAKERDLTATTKDLKATQAELAAAQEYFDKLKPDCIEEGLSFEERAKMRQEEIDSLKEAFDILDGISDE